MRGATQCARRVKQGLQSLRQKLGKVSRPHATDPITQVVLGVLSRNVPETKARHALDVLRGHVVDFNELRVIPIIELSELLHDYPDGRTKCEDINRALNGIFALEHDVTLEHLRTAPQREVLSYLAGIDGLEPYTRARIRLLGLGQHAVPLDEAMWAYARRQRMVDAHCSLDEAQSFLERQLDAEQGLEFVALVHKQAWSEHAAAVQAGEVERIHSVPPERRTSHMLADLAPAAVAAPDFGDDADFDSPEPAPVIVRPAAKPAPKPAGKPAKPARPPHAAAHSKRARTPVRKPRRARPATKRTKPKARKAKRA